VSRLKQFLLAHKVVASVAASALVSAGALGGTYANFSVTPVTIANNAFATGTLTIARDGAGAIFSSANQKIGEESTGSVTIANTGTLDGAFTLSGSGTGSLAPSLKLVVYKDTDKAPGSKLYDGALGSFSSADLGTIGGGSSRTYFFHVSLPSTGSDATDNALQGKSASASFTWSAVQA
jgi:spore coat-associated protein N